MKTKTFASWVAQAALATASAIAIVSPAKAQTGTKISALPTVSAITGTETVPVVQSGATKGATVSQVGAAILGTLPARVTAVEGNITSNGAAISGLQTSKLNADASGLSVAAAYTLSTGLGALPALAVPAGTETSNLLQANGTAVKTSVALLGTGRTVIGDAVVEPTSGPAYATSGTGNLTGLYYYTVSYVTALGETGPWSGNGPGVTTSANSVAVSSIPTGPTGVIARKLYRTKAGTNVTEKQYYLVATIADNTTTTYADNTTDASLGTPPAWAPTNRGNIVDGSGVNVARFGWQSVSMGQNTGSGYASVAIGWNAFASNVDGRRDTAVGEFSLASNTSGYENVGLGTHAGQNVTTQYADTLVGAYAGFNIGVSGGATTGNNSVAIGRSALYGTAAGLGSNNVAVGAYACSGINTASSVLCLGSYAGQYANANNQLYIDPTGNFRANLAASQDAGLIYGVSATTGQAQELRLNATVRIGWGGATVAQLPTCAAGMGGKRATVTDASVAYTSTNVGATVAGSGTNTAPVFCNATASAAGNWVIG